MDIKTKKWIGLASTVFLTISLATPSLVQADKGHHGHHGHHHEHHNHHSHHDHRHSDRYVRIYSQPPVYYQQHYPQPQHNYNYNYYPPAPVYVVPPQVNMGINTRNIDFMLRF